MLSSIRFGKFVLIAVVASFFAGCASTQQRILPEPEILASFKPDCNIAKEQVEWLRSIRPTLREKRDAYLEVQTWGGFSKDFRKNKEIASGKIDYLIDNNIDEIYYRCNFRHKSS